MAATFPPTVPAKLQDRLTIEIVDENTVKIKLLDGTVLKTMTKAEYLSLPPSITTSEG